MPEGSEFRRGLQNLDGETAQRKIAGEFITNKLFAILCKLDLDNGDTVGLDKITAEIAEQFGLQSYKEQIAQCIIETLQRKEYQYTVDPKRRIIRANYDRLYQLQRASDKDGRKKAEAKLKKFVEKAEEYAKKLESEHIEVTEYTLLDQFAQEDLEHNRSWIEIAIYSVVDSRNQER